jgi:hypothetical protein
VGFADLRQLSWERAIRSTARPSAGEGLSGKGAKWESAKWERTKKVGAWINGLRAVRVKGYVGDV